VPGKQRKAALVVELDEQRFLDRLENPEAGDDQKEVAEHQQGKGNSAFRIMKTAFKG
jgi:hypothetical protein